METKRCSKKQYQYVLIFIFFGIFGLAENSKAATVYVDKTLSADCTSGNYSIANRNCTGLDGNAYNTLQEVVYGTADAEYNGINPKASSGDAVYLRGGTYTENYGPQGDYFPGGSAMQISRYISGSDGAWTTIASYPGEWAVIQGNTSTCFALGYAELSKGTAKSIIGQFHHIKFERLEITGGTHGGLGLIGGPFQIRYCYFHDNGYSAAIVDDRNKSGLAIMQPQHCVIEYNLFKDNGYWSGTVDNGTDLVLYSDYDYGNYVFSTSRHANEIRYNFFNSADPLKQPQIAIHGKATQRLCSHGLGENPGYEVDDGYRDQGDKIHHNIILGGYDSGIIPAQDYSQVYNNVAEITGGDVAAIGGTPSDTDRSTYKLCTYNNTVIGGYIAPQCHHESLITSMKDDWFGVNNIVDQMDSNEYSASIGLMTRIESLTSYDWSGTTIDRNLVHSSGTNYHITLPNGWNNKYAYWLTVSAFNSAHGVTNYTNNNSGLFSSGYLTNKDFAVGSTTIEQGGYNAAHPYLAGVMIPEYIGATNPDDDAWVAGVMGLAATSNLQNGGSGDPAWIEGAVPGDTTPPATPSGLAVS